MLAQVLGLRQGPAAPELRRGGAEDAVVGGERRTTRLESGGQGAAPTVTEVELPRRLENPDGMRFAADGRLLVLEGAIGSGDGRVVRIDVLGDTPGPRPIEVLTSGMESPVNLTVTGDGRVWVTEARQRERLLRGAAAKAPDAFWVTVLPGRR
ncbi:hypothetical protein [Myxococcus sp. RHSTA-1-4]|uniref:hypothetical protein n=1 Tax=Myxococcus sp. RHSTA-1-4 TaxID=2874601 RepID=UPI001CC122E5|nr:hypothetical protein [Myxococcus sp. RHSTA-1-4]MBZ4416997.1 hypothetical protein [Myxococcus sp. RHSTA-1-4]